MSNKFPGAAARPLLDTPVPPNRNIKHLAHIMVLNAGQLLSLSTSMIQLETFQEELEELHGSIGAGCFSLNQAPVCGNQDPDTHHLHLCSCKLLSLSGPQFPYLQNGSHNISRKHTIHTSCLEQCLARQKGLLSISCITFLFFIITIVTIYFIYIIFPTMSIHLLCLPTVAQGISNWPKSHSR